MLRSTVPCDLLTMVRPLGSRRPRRCGRSGAIAVIAAFCMVFVLGLVALGVDLGRLLSARTELQRCADAAALAACSELLVGRNVENAADEMIRAAGARIAKLNRVAQRRPKIDVNRSNTSEGGLVLGYVADPTDSTSPMAFDDPDNFNSVQIRVERTVNQNGELPLLFARVWGLQGQSVQAEARASFLVNFRGFRIPKSSSSGSPTCPMLPITVHEEAWKFALNGQGVDELEWDSNEQSVNAGRDGKPEFSIFPQRTESGGNFGLLDIGSNSSHPGTIQRQIRNGLNKKDLAFHGGSLQLDEFGELRLSGNPGLKTGIVLPALRSIIGETRILPIYRSVESNGNPAVYTIVGFAGVRVMAVDLTSATKMVKVQPAAIVTRGGIPADYSEGKRSDLIYSPVILTN